MVIFPLPLLEDQRDFSLMFTMRTWKSSWRKNSYKWIYLECVSLRIVHTEPPAIYQVQLRFSYQGIGSSQVGFCSGKLDSLYLPVYLSKLHSSLLWHLISLADVRRVADFSVCLAFYLLLGGSYDSSAPDMLNWKPKSLRSICSKSSLVPTQCYSPHLFSPYQSSN